METNYTSNAASPAMDKMGLRHTLIVDSLGCGISGAALLLLAPSAAELLGVESPFPVQVIGGLLVAIAAFIFFSLLQTPIRSLNTGLVIGGNILWVIASIALLLINPWTFTPIGVTIVLVQAIVVAILAGIEWVLWQRR
jgi:hypothetical protein